MDILAWWKLNQRLLDYVLQKHNENRHIKKLKLEF